MQKQITVCLYILFASIFNLSRKYSWLYIEEFWSRVSFNMVLYNLPYPPIIALSFQKEPAITHPDPVSNHLTLSMSHENLPTTFELFDQQGRKVMTKYIRH